MNRLTVTGLILLAIGMTSGIWLPAIVPVPLPVIVLVSLFLGMPAGSLLMFGFIEWWEDRA